MAISEKDIKAQAYDALMTYFRRNNIRLSETQVDKIVGGKKRRERLIATRKLTDYHKGDAPNSPWQYSAAEVYAQVRTYNK